MLVVRSSSELEENYYSASRDEALTSFGDGSMFIGTCNLCKVSQSLALQPSISFSLLAPQHFQSV